MNLRTLMAREYDIAKTSGQCCRCERILPGGEEFVAVVLAGQEQFRREDYCPTCWDQRPADSAEAFCIWRGRIPTPAKPRQQLVGNEMLLDVFQKLDGQQEPSKLNLRFVLALMLMRKKLLVYDRSDTDAAGSETWTMHHKGQDAPIEVAKPQLDDEKIAQLAEQLGALFEVPQ